MCISVHQYWQWLSWHNRLHKGNPLRSLDFAQLGYPGNLTEKPILASRALAKGFLAKICAAYDAQANLLDSQALWASLNSRAMQCRDHGQRVPDRQKTRLMWLVEEMGAETFRQAVTKYIGYDLKPGKHVTVCLLSAYA